MPLPALTWRPTNAPPASSRTDDIWFCDPDHGWAVNSSGQILHTTDGGASWQEQLHDDVYFRCVGFASPTRGWVGTLTPGRTLFETTNGGDTWQLVTDLPELAPSAVCGLSVVDDSVAYASGTNFPTVPPRMMRTVDGGATWTAWDMSPHATLLVDTYFSDADRGWVVGGKADLTDQSRPLTRDDVRAVVLRTEDGGKTWVNRVAQMTDVLPRGEWGWKIQFLDDQLGFVALESFVRGAILRTTDGGATWTRIEINDPQRNANLEGVGFLDESTGWVGGWGSANFRDGFSSATADGGKTWQNANEIGRFINRFRFLGKPITVGYASGRTVYKYSSEPVPPPPEGIAAEPRLLVSNEPRDSSRPLRIDITVPDGAARLTIDVWDRFGAHAGRVLEETAPAPGPRTVEWDVTDSAGAPLPSGSFIIRVTIEGVSESQIVRISD